MLLLFCDRRTGMLVFGEEGGENALKSVAASLEENGVPFEVWIEFNIDLNFFLYLFPL